METKQAYIQRIVTEHPADGHKLGIQTNYLVCEKCGMRTLRNSVREKIQQLHESPCWNGAWELPNQWAGHPTHEIWRRANRAYCSVCGGQRGPLASKQAAAEDLHQKPANATAPLLQGQNGRATRQQNQKGP